MSILLIDDKEWLENEYINLRKSSIQIAKEQNVSSPTILQRLKKFGIKIRTLSEARRGKESWNKGKKLSEEHKRKLSEAKIGKYIGEKHPNWKGDNIKYGQLHARIRKSKEKLKHCEKCGREKKLQLSFNHSLGNYTFNTEDYEWLCSECHMGKDGTNIGFSSMRGSFKKGNIPWNKGRTDVYSKGSLKAMSESHRGRKQSMEKVV